MPRRLRLRKLPVLPLVLGITDGILNALTLAAGAILRGSGDGLSVTLAGRVGAASCVTAAFTMFVADYAERRSRLVRASKELNMTEPGRLAATSLGRAVARESALAAGLAAVASLVGAAGPLLMGTLPHVPPWVALVVTILLLGVLGWLIGIMLSARRLRWAIVMLLGGIAVTFIGAWLNIA